MTDERVVLEGGEVLSNTHPSNKCIGEYCTIHNMSPHQFRHLPQHWNGAYMERIDVINAQIWPDPDDPHAPEHPNAIRCLVCNETLYSRTRHDFRSCAGGHVFTDGGTDYQRIGFDDTANYSVITDWPVTFKEAALDA